MQGTGLGMVGHSWYIHTYRSSSAKQVKVGRYDVENGGAKLVISPTVLLPRYLLADSNNPIMQPSVCKACAENK